MLYDDLIAEIEGILKDVVTKKPPERAWWE